MAEIHTSNNAVNPAHYKDVYPFEVIEVIKSMLSDEEFRGYCLGNELKYRLRAGIKKKDTALEDIHKAEWYRNERNKNGNS